MDNGQGEPAVRILPGDGSPPHPPESSGSWSPRWFLPAGVLTGIALVFVLATGGTTDTSQTTTTRPPPIASVNAEELDFRTSTNAVTTQAWTALEIAGATRVHDVIRAGGQYVAVGSTTDGAQVWTSGSGTAWSAVRSIENPEGSTSIVAVASGATRLIGLGSVDETPAVWISPTTYNWTYSGALDESVRGSIVGLAAGNDLLAIVQTENGYLGWTSHNGTEWQALEELQGLDDGDLYGVTAGLDAYYAYGLESGCAMIYRSEDGRDWDQTFDPGEGCGAVVDITATDDRLLALGWTSDNFGWARVAVWESTDGTGWHRLGLDEPLFAGADLDFEVVESTASAKPVARVRVDGALLAVTDGTTLETDVGRFTIERVTDDGIDLAQNSSAIHITEGLLTRFWSVLEPKQIAVEGQRIVVVGNMTTEGWRTPVPVAWTSSDDGRRWSMDVLSGRASQTYEVGTRAASVVVVGSDSLGVAAWHTSWDTTEAAAAATQLVETYLTAISRYDPAGVLLTLPDRLSGAGANDYRVPSLGHEIPGWWNEAGELDSARVADTMQYLDAVGTSLTYRDCHAAIALGPIDRANVACEVTVSSSLLRIYGVDEETGRLRASVQNGTIESVALDPAPGVGVFTLLGDLLRVSEDRGEPLFTADSAAVHIDAAHSYLASLLGPGETKIVDTALGRIEWTWVEPLDFAPDSFPGSVVWTRFGFAASLYSGSGQATLYTSADGRDWSEVPVPTDLESIWGIQPFRDGLLANAWDGSRNGVVFFDGVEWTPIDLPASAADADIISTVARPESAVIATMRWTDDGQPESLGMYVIETDLTVHAAPNPPEVLTTEPEWWFGGVELVASTNGFLATVTNYATLDTSVWVTPDGLDWTLLTERVALDDALGFWNLQQHRNRYFVVGQGAEMVCYDTEFGEECATVAQMWTSPDGTQWRELRTTDGEVVASSDIGSGPLGLVAFGDAVDGVQQPRALYVSADGESWERVNDLAFLYRGQTVWWSTAHPAISTDTIVLFGVSYREDGSFGGKETPFLIVGKLINE